MRTVRSFILAALLALGTACAVNTFSTIQPGLEQRGHYIEGVSFYGSGKNECGPASVAAVLSYWGSPTGMQQISERIYERKLGGTLPMDIERFLREREFSTVSSAGTLEDIRKQVRGNVPVISLLDQGIGPYRRPHYVTVIGFDDRNQLIIAHDGTIENNLIGYDRFLKEWARAGHWMLVAKPAAREAGQKP